MLVGRSCVAVNPTSNGLSLGNVTPTLYIYIGLLESSTIGFA